MEKIAIAGAGLVGSLLSLYLAKAGFEVDVYERRPDNRGETQERGRSINLAMSQRGWLALQQIGAEDHFAPLAIPMYGRMIHHENGETTFQAYGQENDAIYSISRAALNRELAILASRHANVRYHFDSRLSHVDLKNNIFTIENTQTKQTLQTQSDVSFAADGAFSAARLEMMFQKRFDYTQDYLDHGYKELHIPPAADGSWLLKKNALHIWPRRTFMLIALPNTDGSFTCTLFLAFDGEDSFANLQTEAQVQQFFETEFPDAAALMPTLLHDFFHNPTEALLTVRCYPWVHGNVALIGDAAHAIVPFYGQGMNAGFEDVRILNDLIQQHRTPTHTDWQRILQQYQQLRKPDGDAIGELALRNFVEMRDTVANPRFQLRKKIEKYLHSHFPERFTPAYSLVSFSSQVRYSEALRRTDIQNRLFDKWLDNPEFEADFTNNNVADPVLQAFIDEYESAVAEKG